MSAAKAKAKAQAPAKKGPGELWNDFFFAKRDPRLASVLRIGFGVLVLVNVLCLGTDLDYFFGEDGVLPAAKAALVINADATSLLHVVPLHLAYALFLAQTLLLIAGVGSRIQAVSVLVWLTAFQHRNYAIVDGEDTVMRLFAFYLALAPSGWAFSFDAWLRKRRHPDAEPPAPWGLRLMQLQMCVIYLSSAYEKSTGHDWTSGKAMYFVARLDDSFGRFPVPAYPFEHLWLIKLMTWGTLALEWGLPIALWVKKSRKTAVVVGLAFHLAIDWTMNLFLFHWLMMLGLVAFLEFDELPVLRRLAK